MTLKNGMRPVHPGEILRDELQALCMSANALSKALGVPVNPVTAILHGQRGVTADTALRLARYFGTTPQVWLNLQQTYELRRAEITVGCRIKANPPLVGRSGRRRLRGPCGAGSPPGPRRAASGCRARVRRAAFRAAERGVGRMEWRALPEESAP